MKVGGSGSCVSGLLVSVIVAIYNSEKYLRQTLDSLMAQTLKDIEFILVDDGSTDSSQHIMQEYAEKDDRIRLIFNREESDGAAMARNLGIEAAKGRYLSVLDADDFFEPDMLRKAYDTAVENNADVVIFDGYRYDDRNGVDLERNSILCRDKLPQDKTVFSPDENSDRLFSMTLGAAWNILVRKEQVDKHGLKFRSFHHADDLEFVFLNFALSERIAVLPERLVHYRVNISGSQASMISRWPDTAWQAMLSFKDRLCSYGLYEKYRTAFIRKAMQYLMFYIDNMDNSESFERLYRSLQDGKLRELDLYSASESELGDEHLASVRDILINIPPQEYLYRKLRKEPPFDRAVAWKKRIPEKSRLILYGADRMGVDVFHSILWDQDYKVVAWVDKQFKELGYPVLSPEVIKENPFDYILVTNASEQIYDSIRSSLIDQGIEEDRIRWIMA